ADIPVSANIHLSALSYVPCSAFLPSPASLNRPPPPMRPARSVRPPRPVRPTRSARVGSAGPDDQLGCHPDPEPGRDRAGHPVDKRTQRLPSQHAEVLPHG